MSPNVRKTLTIAGLSAVGVIFLFAVYQLLFGSTESSSGAAVALTTAAAAGTRKAIRDQVLTSLTEWLTEAKKEEGKMIRDETIAEMEATQREIEALTLQEKVDLANAMEAPDPPTIPDGRGEA